MSSWGGDVRASADDETPQPFFTEVVSRSTLVDLAPRHSRSGAELPVVGLIIDPDAPVSIDDQRVHALRLGGNHLVIIDGVRNDAWHVVVVTRLPSNRARATNEHFMYLKALESLGVRQVLSGEIVKFDRFGYARRIQQEDVIDIRELSPTGASLGATTCGRLLTGLSLSASNHGFEIVSSEIDAYMISKSEHERKAASALGMCYASIDVLPDANRETQEEAQSAIVETMLAALGSISLLATCTCVARRRSRD